MILCFAFLTSACGQDKIYYTVNKIDNVNIYIEKDGRLIKNQNGSLNEDQEFYIWLVVNDGFTLSEDFSVLINGNNLSMTKYVMEIAIKVIASKWMKILLLTCKAK